MFELQTRFIRITAALVGAGWILEVNRPAWGSTVDVGTVMPLGDSITYGQSIYGSIPGAWRDPFYSQMVADGYAFQFVGTQSGNSDATLQAAGESQNEGHSGFTIAPISGRDGISDNIGSWLSQVGDPPAYILLMIGTNDVNLGDLDGADNRLAALIGQISNPVTGLDPGGRLIVSTILPDTASAQTEADVQSFNAGVLPVVRAAELAGENVGYANIGPTINPATDMTDILHPNTAGEQVIASGWVAAVLSGATVAATQWTGPTAGGSLSWAAATNWSTGIPESPGVTATLATGITGVGLGTGSGAVAGTTVTLDGNFTVGHLVFNNSYGFAIAPGTGGTLTINDTGPVAAGTADVTVLAGSHTIGVPLILTHGVAFNVGSGCQLTVAGPVSGAGGVSVAGPGRVVFSAVDTYTGPTTVAAGTLTIAPGGELPAATDLTIGTGAGVVNASGTGAIQLDSLGFAGSTGGWTGTFDIGSGAVDLASGVLATVNSQVREGYALTQGGTWDGPGGITSSAAAADPSHLTAVGVILNDVAGTAIYQTGNPFDGVVPSLDDVLLRVTDAGDANLDGTVDGSDYSLIDNGYASGGLLTGWYNGDFNYDGVIDGTDYALMDNAFNNQQAAAVESAVVTGLAVQASEVPEPSALTLLLPGVAAFISVGCRRRRPCLPPKANRIAQTSCPIRPTALV